MGQSPFKTLPLGCPTERVAVSKGGYLPSIANFSDNRACYVGGWWDSSNKSRYGPVGRFRAAVVTARGACTDAGRNVQDARDTIAAAAAHRPNFSGVGPKVRSRMPQLGQPEKLQGGTA